MASEFNRERIIEEARARLSSLYERYMNEIEAEADRILREKLSELEPLKRELVESLREFKA